MTAQIMEIDSLRGFKSDFTGTMLSSAILSKEVRDAPIILDVILKGIGSNESSQSF